VSFKNQYHICVFLKTNLHHESLSPAVGRVNLGDVTVGLVCGQGQGHLEFARRGPRTLRGQSLQL